MQRRPAESAPRSGTGANVPTRPSGSSYVGTTTSTTASSSMGGESRRGRRAGVRATPPAPTTAAASVFGSLPLASESTTRTPLTSAVPHDDERPLPPHLVPCLPSVRGWPLVSATAARLLGLDPITGGGGLRGVRAGSARTGSGCVSSRRVGCAPIRSVVRGRRADVGRLGRAGVVAFL